MPNRRRWDQGQGEGQGGGQGQARGKGEGHCKGQGQGTCLEEWCWLWSPATSCKLRATLPRPRSSQILIQTITLNSITIHHQLTLNLTLPLRNQPRNCHHTTRTLIEGCQVFGSVQGERGTNPNLTPFRIQIAFRDPVPKLKPVYWRPSCMRT